MLPFAVFVSFATVVAGQIMARFRIARPTVWIGYVIGVLSYALMYHYFTSTLPYSRQNGLLVLAGIGCGLSLQTPLVIIQATLPLKELAAGTAAWTLTRSLGGSVGVSIVTAILNTNLRTRFARIPGNGTDCEVPTSAAGYTAIHNMPDGPLKSSILAAFADSFKPAWLVNACFFAACLLVTLPTRSYSFRGPPQRKPAAEAEEETRETETPDSDKTEVAGVAGVVGDADDAKPELSALSRDTPTTAVPELVDEKK
jgi:hypothetical protein